MAIVISPLKLESNAAKGERVLIDKVSLTFPELAEDGKDPPSYDWLYWVSIDNARTLHTHPDVTANTLWLGLTPYRGGGATIVPFALQSGTRSRFLHRRKLPFVLLRSSESARNTSLRARNPEDSPEVKVLRTLPSG